MIPKKVVIFGTGGREHALATHLSESEDIEKVFVIPGNPAMPQIKIERVDIPQDDYVSFCKDNQVDYAIIGPEALLEKGLSDTLEKNNIPCASPSKKASVLETSKAFSKNLMQKYNIPTATFKVFTDATKAIEYINNHESDSFVVKLSGLAAGKGVIICHSKSESVSAVKILCQNNEELVIEEFLEGKELSLFALCLENQYQVLGTACDYKRLRDNDQGPNTGGMGCYSPTYWLKDTEQDIIEKDILIPTLKAMLAEDLPFKGILFIGIMMTQDGPMVLEYNVRFGDPETQTILPRLETNLHSALYSIATNNKELLKESNLHLKQNFSVHIVKAAKGYPGVNGEKIERGKKISNNLSATKGLYLYYAGITASDSDYITSGGRILGLTSLANTLQEARELAYKNINFISFEGQQFRKDIGK